MQLSSQRQKTKESSQTLTVVERHYQAREFAGTVQLSAKTRRLDRLNPPHHLQKKNWLEMKSLIVVIAAGGAVVGGLTPLDSLTTEDLEASTKEFVESFKATPLSTRKLEDRKMVKYGVRTSRWGSSNAKSGKGNKPSGGTSGKSSKGGHYDNFDDDWGSSLPSPDLDLFRMLPVACPGYCVSSYNRNFEMVNALSRCSGTADKSQWWKVHSDGSYVMVESYDTGLCISVDFEYGDRPIMLARACSKGIVTLRDCGADSGTQWYFTGGQLVNSLCWAAGVASTLTVYPDPKKQGQCDGAVSVFGTSNDAILRADTFMFVNRLPIAPFEVERTSLLDDDAVELEPTLEPTLAPSLSPTRKKKPKMYEDSN